MKKVFTILMAILFLVTFNTTDADAKKIKKRSQTTDLQFDFDANLIGCAHGECGGFEISLHLNGPSGTVAIGSEISKASVVSFRGNRIKIKFSNKEYVGYLVGKIIEAFASEIYVLRGYLTYKNMPSLKLPFILVDTNAGFEYP